MKQKPNRYGCEANMVKAKLNAPTPLSHRGHRGHPRGFVGIGLFVSMVMLLSAAALLGGYQSLLAAFLAFNVCALAVICSSSKIDSRLPTAP